MNRLNIKKRAKLIGAEIELKSKINEGTELIMVELAQPANKITAAINTALNFKNRDVFILR